MNRSSIFSIVAWLLFINVSALNAGSWTLPDSRFTFDAPDGYSFRKYPSASGGAFIPITELGNRYYFAALRLELFWDQWTNLETALFLEKWAVLACAADGADSSQWCEEGSVTVAPFSSRSGVKGYRVKRTRTVEFYRGETKDKQEFEDLIIAFDLRGPSPGKYRIAAFVCEDLTCRDAVEMAGMSFR